MNIDIEKVENIKFLQHLQKQKNIEIENKKNKNKNLKEDGHIKILSGTDDIIPKKKVSKRELIATILFCIINLIFYPPLLNKVFIKKNNHLHSINFKLILLIIKSISFTY